MVNHGMVALGQTPAEVLNIMLMADKWAHVLLGTYAMGGPNYLSETDVDRIDSRLDEHYRRGRLSRVNVSQRSHVRTFEHYEKYSQLHSRRPGRVLRAGAARPLGRGALRA